MVRTDQIIMVRLKPSLNVPYSLVQTGDLGQVSLLVTHSPAISKLIEVAGEAAIRLHILIIRVTIIVSTKATHICLVGTWQNHVCSGERGLCCHCVFVLCCIRRA